MLGNSTRLTGDDVRISDEVQQGCLSVVNVSHDGDNRRTRCQVLFTVLFNLDGLLYLRADEVGLVAEFFCDNGDRLRVQSLVDGYHDAERHAGRNDLVDVGVHHVRQFSNGYKLRQLERHRFLLLALQFLFRTFRDGASLRPAQLRGVGLLASAQACERLLNFFLDVCLADFLLGLVSSPAPAIAALSSSRAGLTFDVDFRDALALAFVIV